MADQEKLSFDDILNRIRDKKSSAVIALEEMDKYAVLLRNELVKYFRKSEVLAAQNVLLQKELKTLRPAPAPPAPEPVKVEALPAPDLQSQMEGLENAFSEISPQ